MADSLTFVDTLVDASDATVYTFSDATLGTPSGDRNIILAIMGRCTGSSSTPSSVTIGGVTADLVVGQSRTDTSNRTFVGLYALKRPANATDDIVVTFPNAQSRCTVSVYNLANANLTASDTGSASSGTSSLSTTVDVTANSTLIAIAAASVTTDLTLTFTGVNVNDEDHLEASNYIVGSQKPGAAETGRTISVGGLGNNPNVLAVAAFEPITPSVVTPDYGLTRLGGCETRSGGTVALTPFSHRVQNFLSSGTVTLPNAYEIALTGYNAFYIFAQSGAVTVNDYQGSTLLTVSSGNAGVLWLNPTPTDTAGQWTTLQKTQGSVRAHVSATRSNGVDNLWVDDPVANQVCTSLYTPPAFCETIGSFSIPTQTSILFRDAGASGPPYASHSFPRIANDGSTARWQGTVDYSGAGGSATTLVTVSLGTDSIWRLTSDDGFWTNLAPAGVGYSNKYGADWGSAATPVVGFEYATEAQSPTAVLPCDTGEMVYTKFHAGPALVDAGYGTAVKVSEASGITTYKGLGLATSTFAGTYVVPYPIPDLEVTYNSGTGMWAGPLGATQAGDENSTSNSPEDVLDYGNGPTDMSYGLYVKVLP